VRRLSFASTAAFVVSVVLVAACSSTVAPAGSTSATASLAPAATGTSSPPSVPSATAKESLSFGLIVGKWKGFQRCADIVKALTKAGFTEFIADDIVGNGLRPDLTSNDQVDLKNPCKGAVDREHFHDFYPDGRFDSIDFNGQQVDDGTFTTTPGHVTIGDVTFDVAFEGDSKAVVTVNVPANCGTPKCRGDYAWATMVTMPGSTWERVR